MGTWKETVSIINFQSHMLWKDFISFQAIIIQYMSKIHRISLDLSSSLHHVLRQLMVVELRDKGRQVVMLM